MNTAAAVHTTDSLAARIGKLAHVLAAEHFPNADRAALKRHATGQPPPLAFYRLWLRYLNDELPSENQTQAWALIAWGLALMGRNAHRPDRPLGRTLAEAGYSEARLERLLQAPDDVRFELFTSAVRFMAAKGEGFDWCDAARLLLTTDAEKREQIHRRIAADFYRHQRTDKE